MGNDDNDGTRPQEHDPFEDGVQSGPMSITSDGETLTGTMPGPTLAGGIGEGSIEMDNIYYVSSPEDTRPTSENARGRSSEWDVTSLDAIKTWLHEHGAYVQQLYWGLEEIKTLVDGPNPGQYNPLGGFPNAKGEGSLHAKHTALQQQAYTALGQIAESLLDASEAVDKIKENYETIEDANEMNARDMERIFSELGGDQHDLSTEQ